MAVQFSPPPLLKQLCLQVRGSAPHSVNLTVILERRGSPQKMDLRALNKNMRILCVHVCSSGEERILPLQLLSAFLTLHFPWAVIHGPCDSRRPLLHAVFHAFYVSHTHRGHFTSTDALNARRYFCVSELELYLIISAVLENITLDPPPLVKGEGGWGHTHPKLAQKVICVSWSPNSIIRQFFFLSRTRCHLSVSVSSVYTTFWFCFQHFLPSVQFSVS